MTDIKPVVFTWDGEAMVPLARASKLCDRQFVIGERYNLVPHEERSQASHNHYFAKVHEAWLNLPEDRAAQFATDTHLRKYALIRANYCNERTHVCESKAEAHRMAAFIQPIDEYAIVKPFDNLVRVWTAKSQTVRAMGKKDFEASKQAVLEIVAAMIGVKPDDLGKAA